MILIFVCLLDDLILDFYFSYLTRQTGGLELATPITLVLQANRLTKCAYVPNMFPLYFLLIKDTRPSSIISLLTDCNKTDSLLPSSQWSRKIISQLRLFLFLLEPVTLNPRYFGHNCTKGFVLNRFREIICHCLQGYARFKP